MRTEPGPEDPGRFVVRVSSDPASPEETVVRWSKLAVWTHAYPGEGGPAATTGVVSVADPAEAGHRVTTTTRPDGTRRVAMHRGGLLESERFEAADGTVLASRTHHPAALLDAATAQPAASYLHGPFGQLLAAQGHA